MLNPLALLQVICYHTTVVLCLGEDFEDDHGRGRANPGPGSEIEFPAQVATRTLGCRDQR